MSVTSFDSGFNIDSSTKVDQDELVDAVLTLKPGHVLNNELKNPGKGPDFFLKWAKKELEIGNNSENESDRNRAFFNSTCFPHWDTLKIK